MDDDMAEEVFHAEIIETDINDLCRICGSTSDSPLIPIYDENGLAEDLASKIMLYLPIKVSEEDALPIKTCVNCTNGVLTWHLLYECCVDADRRFKAMFSEEQLIQPQPRKKSGKDKTYENTETSKPEENVNETNQVEEHEMEDVMFLKAEFGPEDEQYLEDETHLADGELEPKSDDQPVKRPASFESFLEPSSSSPIGSEFIVLDIQHDTRLNDAVDNKPYEEEQARPERQDNITHYVCPGTDCQIGYYSKSEFCAHLINAHKDNHELLIMLGQQSSQADKKTIRDARTVVDGRTMFKCPECDKMLSTSYCFKNHLRIHTNERPYICFFCNKSFRIYSGIVRHIQGTHLQLKKFTCEICNSKFTSRDNLRQHSFLHADDKPYVCDICGKGFKQKASLFLHSRTHLDSFPYKCAYCGKGFRFKTPMLYHLSIHTGEKANTCEICGKMFRLKNDLNQHRQLHSTEKPFKCTECPEAFKQKRYLSRHCKTHHANSSVISDLVEIKKIL